MKTSEDVVKEREGLYGHPYDNFANIASLWNVYLHGKRIIDLGAVKGISRQDVAHMMILLKVARTINTPYNEDSPVDIAGYARCIQMIKEKENE